MIQDVDESLRALVKRDALNGSKADVAFDAPNKEWASRRNTPTVDLYLYDIREDLEQREVMWEDIRGDSRDSRLITERRPPPRRFKLSYLVTAWTQRPEDEHRLLSSLLACFLRNPIIPADRKHPGGSNRASPPTSPVCRRTRKRWFARGKRSSPAVFCAFAALTARRPNGRTAGHSPSPACGGGSGWGRKRVAGPCASTSRVDRGARPSGRRSAPCH